MKVFALGGYGTFGRHVAKNLCASDMVTEIVIGGRDLAAAGKLALELGEKARAVRVDASDEASVRLAAMGSDLLVNTAGPDYKVAYPATKAAIDAGVDYCDLSADCDATMRLLELDDEAKAADATILMGIGFGPGETNLLMKHAAQKLDRVDDLKLIFTYNLVGMISFFGSDDPGKAAADMRRTGRVNASWETVMNWGGGRVCVFRDGRLVDVDPSEHQEKIDIPGEGEFVFFPMGGPEPVTIPRFLRNIRSASFMVCVLPPQVSGLYLELAGRMRRKEIDPGEAAIRFHEGVAEKISENKALESWRKPGIVLRAIATGTKDGRRVRYSCWPAWDYMGASSALTVAALRILRGDVKERGVLAPEACFEPMDFFGEVARLVSKDPPTKELLMESTEELDE